MTPEEWANQLVNGNYDESMWASFDHVDGYDEPELIKLLADTIRQAIAEERDECLKIVRSAHSKYYCEYLEDGIDPVDLTRAYKACEEIETSIRNRTP